MFSLRGISTKDVVPAPVEFFGSVAGPSASSGAAADPGGRPESGGPAYVRTLKAPTPHLDMWTASTCS